MNDPPILQGIVETAHLRIFRRLCVGDISVQRNCDCPLEYKK